MFVYKITNKINGKMYIGYDTGPINEHRRWIVHQYAIKHLYNRTIFYNAMRKHGIENFGFEIIDKTAQNVDELANLEIYYIKKLKTLIPNGYNMSEGGFGGDNFKHMSKGRLDKVKKKMSEKQREKIENDSEYKKQKQKNMERARKKALEIKNNLSEEEYKEYCQKKSETTYRWWKDRELTDDDRKRYSEGQKKRFDNLTEEEWKEVGEISRKAREKIWRVESPTGEIFEVKGLKRFCQENGLNYNILFSSKRYNKKAHGWLVTLI